MAFGVKGGPSPALLPQLKDIDVTHILIPFPQESLVIQEKIYGFIVLDTRLRGFVGSTQ